jgi:hypothetical protein
MKLFRKQSNIDIGITLFKSIKVLFIQRTLKK